LPESWTAADQHGTPGNPNGIYLMIRADQLNNELDIRVVPNPFGTSTRFLLISGKQQDVTLEILNLSGLRVMVFPQMNLALGTHQLIWDGMDNYCNPLPPGIYICHITSGNLNLTRKLIKVK
jgi:flagellar hook assembly protein FlgD